MKRQVRVFVEGRQLDLFNDETIEVTSTIQNIQDISKTFTDFSQSFTIPTSANNNAIWQYFYENALNSSINYQERLDGYIEIDMTFFRRGKIQMEKSQLKNGQPNSYTITFYGDVTTLKDIIGEDLLSDLDYTPFNHDYTFAEVFNRVRDGITDYDVCYPLITSNRIWEYQNAAPYANIPQYIVNQLGLTSNDISTVAGRIDYRELFPALKISAIFNAIENTYGVNFTGSFLTDQKFDQAYLWYKNKNDFEFSGEPQPIDFDTIVSQSTPNYPIATYFDLVNNTISVPYVPTSFIGVQYTIKLIVTAVSSPTTTYWIDTYKNGALYSTTQGINTGTFTIYNAFSVQGMNDTISIKVRANFGLTFDSNTRYEILYIPLTLPIPQLDYVEYSNTTLNLSSFTDLAQLAPAMKVQDFISGILKQFNLTCFGTAVNTYEIIPLDDWYAAGAIVDITTYTDREEIGIDRVKLYKKIAYKFQQSSSLMNKAFFEQGLREYGNTEYQFPYDGGEYTIEVPFENLLFNQFFHSGNPTGLQVGYALDNAFAPYIPKPCLLYKYGQVNLAQHIHFTDGAGNFLTNDYVMFGQDLTDSGVNYSLNFAPETSSYWLQVIQNSIFATYYFPYLTNLFNPKNRLTTVKANLPVALLTGLQLNDRLIIRDKRYLINEMKTNMVTGETTFELLNDFMPVVPARIIQVGEAIDHTTTPITLPNNSHQAEFMGSIPDLVFDPPLILASQSITITFPPLTSGNSYSFDTIYSNNDGSTTTQTMIILCI
ncbi:MAG: hypothetical protein ACO27Q_02960 [Bacteroidia bacterium]